MMKEGDPFLGFGLLGGGGAVEFGPAIGAFEESGLAEAGDEVEAPAWGDISDASFHTRTG